MRSVLRRLATQLGITRRIQSFRGAATAQRDARPSDPGGNGRASSNRFERLGGAVGAASRYPVSMQYFARGYDYARQIPAPREVASQATEDPGGPNPLESYFEAHRQGPGIWKWRHYFDIYDRHLARFRGRPVRLVEVGVFGGGSIGMWREYFGPSLHIYGIDIDPSCRALEGEGVTIFIGDQSDPTFWEGFLANSPPIDIVLDDGGHTPAQQSVTLECLLPAMRPGGVYICEDIQGGFQPFHAFVDGLTHPLSAIGFAENAIAGPVHAHVASVHRYPLLTVIEKPPAGPARFESVRHGSDFPSSKWLS
jgi:hypothetical protein